MINIALACYNLTIGGEEKAGVFIIKKHDRVKGPGKLKKRKRKLIISGILILFAALIVFALYSGLTVRKYVIESNKINSGGTVRIVQISDLHSIIFGKDQQQIIDMIRAQRPDIIALTGDIVDDKEPVSGARLFLEGIKDIVPIYYVSGNHEFMSGKYDDIKGMIQENGITVLSNERKVCDYKRS